MKALGSSASIINFRCISQVGTLYSRNPDIAVASPSKKEHGLEHTCSQEEKYLLLVCEEQHNKVCMALSAR